MKTDQPSAADAATTADVRLHWIGRRFSLSQRERAGVRESASNGWGLSQFQSDFDPRRFLPHPLSLSRWERETVGGRSMKSLSSLREVGSLYYGCKRSAEFISLPPGGAPCARALKRTEVRAPIRNRMMRVRAVTAKISGGLHLRFPSPLPKGRGIKGEGTDVTWGFQTLLRCGVSKLRCVCSNTSRHGSPSPRPSPIPKGRGRIVFHADLWQRPLWLRRQPRQNHPCPSVVKLLPGGV
jgi:hypothetical protein